MTLQHKIIVSSISILTVLSTTLQSAGTASDIDKGFAGKVSQGGMYEVEAGKLAEHKAVAQDVKDMAFADVHDHELVNHELRRIASATTVMVASTLNATFQQRLNKLKGLSGAEFDTAYISDMAEIHDMDEKLFAQEAMEGTNEFKAFAAKTDLIVKRHIGALHGTEPR
jgi:putative membrane protein